MPFSIAELLGNLPEDKLIAPKVLAKKLFCEDETDRLRLKIALDALTKLELVTEEFGKYRRLAVPDVVKARLRFSRGSFWAIQDEPGAADIYIPARYLGTAWHGDRGLIKVVRKGRNRRSPEGEVFVVLERAITALLAQVQATDAGYVAKPMDDRLNITVTLPDAVADWVEQLVYVTIARYPLAQMPAQGVVKRVLGRDARAAEPATLVLCKHNLLSDPPPGLPKMLEPQGDELPRQDYRELATWGLGSLAVSWEPGAEGGRLLGIHIRDATAYIPPETLVDWFAGQQGASFALGETRIPMTPPVVESAVWPSLSLWVQIAADGTMGAYRIEPGLVQVDAVPAAELVQGVSDWVLQNGQRPGLRLDEPRLTPDEYPTGLPTAEPVGTTQVAQGLAMLANHLLARHLEALQLPGLFRVQAPPEPEAWERYRFLLTTLGLSVPEELDLATLLPLLQTHELAPLLTDLFLEILKPPTESLQPGAHFGVGYAPYLHGVAGGERYADLFNQRVLRALFIHGKDRKSARSKETIDPRSSECHGRVDWPVLPTTIQEELQTQAQQLLTQLQERERVQRQAREDYRHLVWLHRCDLTPGQTVRGLVVSVESYGFFVAIQHTPLQGLVHVTALKNDWYEFRPKQQALVGRKTNATFAVGMVMDVVVKSIDYYRQQVDLLLPPEVIEAGGETAPLTEGAE
ncbi:MAG: RNB domain-containing ribonuclease [Gloeomargarita sp. DG_2_bins_126]